MPRHGDISVQLSGQDGNAGRIIGSVVEAIREAGRNGTITREEARQSVDEFRMEAMSGDYDHLLQTCYDWVEVF